MNAQDLLIAHGEKILVLIVVAASGYGLYGTFTNPDIRPQDISMERINDMVAKVEKVRAEIAPPVMKPPPNYLDEMTARWAVELPSHKFMTWLSAVTDVGPGDFRGAHYYVYEIRAPKISASDAIGTINVSIELPATVRTTGDPRISDAASKVWTLESRVDNTAQWAGLIVEQKVGNGEWKPVATNDIKNGVVLLKGDAAPVNFSVKTTEPWQRYSFRARLAARVTGLPPDKATSKDVEQSVLVFQGTYPEESINWEQLSKQIVAGDKAALDKFAVGTKHGLLATTLKPSEMLYYSTDSDEASLIGSSSIRFVFEKVMLDFQDPTKSGASFLLTKYLRDPKDQTKGMWLLKPVQFKTKLNDGIGQPDVKIPDPFRQAEANKQGLSRIEDLSTAFVVSEVKTKVKRVLYYEIQPKSRPNGGRAKDLEVIPKEIETEMVVLTNTQTGSTLTLPSCERIVKPNKPLSYFYPDFSTAQINEVDDFKKDPAGFKQRELIPPAPIMHEPGTGPLEDLRKRRNDDLLATDTKYFELADGRIIYFEHVNNRVVVLIKPGSEAAADAAAAAKKEAEIAAAAAAEAAKRKADEEKAKAPASAK
jgi:hypothetical protein